MFTDSRDTVLYHFTTIFTTRLSSRLSLRYINRSFAEAPGDLLFGAFRLPDIQNVSHHLVFSEAVSGN